MADCSDHEDERSLDDDVGLDPRIQSELESLNSAADSINKLENELQRAKAKFRHVKAESSHRLSVLYKKIGKKWVLKARPYYELLRQSQKAQIEAQKAAVKFQRANGIYRAAKETVTLAEQRLFAGDGDGKIAFDAAWQEMLNHATAKFVDAEKEKTACDLEHQTKAAEYVAIQQRLAFMLKDIPRTINKAKPFYDMKDKLETRLHAERQNAEDLQLALICSKQKYRLALASLEAISDAVHMQRELRRRRLQLPLRTPGVGAELDSDLCSELSDMPSASLDIMSETGSQVSWDDFSDSRCVSPALSVDLDFNDMSWTDTTSSLSSLPESSLTSPDSGGGSIWARVGSGLSRFTQEIGRIPSMSSQVSAGSVAGAATTPDTPTNQEPLPKILSPREDVVDGAECNDRKLESNNSIAPVSGWSLPESFRSATIPHSQSVILDHKQHVTDTNIGQWKIAVKPIVSSHSSEALSTNLSVTKLARDGPSVNCPTTTSVTSGGKSSDENSISRGFRSLQLNHDGNVDGVVPTASYTSVLNHSFSSAFSRPPASPRTTIPHTITVTSAPPVTSTTNMMPTVSTSILTSPSRLTAKPPLPSTQRSGSSSPKEGPLTAAPWRRPPTDNVRPVLLRSSPLYQSEQFAKSPRSPAGIAADVPKRSESSSDILGSHSSDQQEIFV
jgi:hypothetical protein